MGRLIDADNLLTAFPKEENEIFHTSAVRGTIEACQTVDAVEVVRCKDCIRYLQIDEVWGRCPVIPYLLRKKDFCSYGLRKDGGNG